jgi:hypothetical protein
MMSWTSWTGKNKKKGRGEGVVEWASRVGKEEGEEGAEEEAG